MDCDITLKANVSFKSLDDFYKSAQNIETHKILKAVFMLSYDDCKYLHDNPDMIIRVNGTDYVRDPNYIASIPVGEGVREVTLQLTTDINKEPAIGSRAEKLKVAKVKGK